MAKTIDLSEFDKYKKRSNNNPCKFGIAISKLRNGEDHEKAIAAIESREIPIASIVRWLEDKGIKDSNIVAADRHRKKICHCFPGQA